MRHLFLLYSIISQLSVGLIALFWSHFLWLYAVIFPLILIGLYDIKQSKHSLWRNYPVLAHWRWITHNIRKYPHKYPQTPTQ